MSAAEILGGAFFSTIFQTLFDKMGSSLYRSWFQESKVDKRSVEDLELTMSLASQLHDDAEDKQIRNSVVRKWLFQLKEAIDDAEQLLDRINFEALRYKQESKPESSRSKRLKLTPSTFDQEIGKIRARLDRLVSQKEVLGLKGVRPLDRLPAPLAVESRVYGRDGDKGRIIDLLLSDDLNGDKISVVSIVGMGGLGKTTLAQLVYDNNEVRDHFKLKAWVTVSDEFSIVKLTRQIFDQFLPQKRENKKVGQHEMQIALREASKESKFLLVLDDVWNRSYDSWVVLLSPFQSGARGSKIVVTTRDDVVAKKMGAETHNLQLISDDDCWRLFVKHAFKNDSFDSHQDLLAIGKEIVRKCKGVPLAIKSLAGLLRGVSDPEEWKRVLKNDIWESQSEILPSLWLSYHYLPGNLKRCFAYCSIFPKDHEFGESRRKTLILLWMAEGLVQIEDDGDACFKDLTSRSLFQQSSTDKSTYIMHDLVHDLAAYVSGDFCFRLEAGNKTNIPSRTRHFSCSSPDDLENFEGLSEAKSLHTCMIQGAYGRPLNSVFLSSLFLPVERCLRAISLSGSGLKVLPESIDGLKHLRYLDLSANYFEKLPDKLCGLYNLQTLLLKYCHKLSKLPTDMGNLVNLRHLDVRGVPLQEMPHEMGNMKDLRTLPKFVVGKNNSSDIKQLSGLSHLPGKLEISGLNNVDGDVSEAILEDKKCLEEIKMCWETAGDDADNLRKYRDRKVLDALKPHTNVKRLDIRSYGGTTFPSWVAHHSYVSITDVSLIGCVNCCCLPPLGQLSSLQFLTIRGCSGVVKIGDEFYGNSSFKIEPFRSLKRFYFRGMLELQEWTFIEGQNGSCFPRLADLSIIGCPKLEMCLPDYFPRQIDKLFPALELLQIDDCPRLAQTFLSRNLTSNSRKLSIYGLGSQLLTVHEEALPELTINENATTRPEAMYRTTPTFLRINIRVRDPKATYGRGFQHLTSLEELKITRCYELQCLPGETLPTSLTSLHINHVPKLEHLGKGFQHLTSLKKLSVLNCKELQCLLGETLPTSLTSLCIENVPKIKDLGKGIQHLTSLEELQITRCYELQCLPGETLPTSLTSLCIENFPKIKDLGKGIQHLISLEKLQIIDCNELQCLPGETLPTSLTFLCIISVPILEHLGKGFQKLTSLEKLQIAGCKELQCLRGETLPTSLTILCIEIVPKLKHLGEGFQHLTSLDELTIRGCIELRCLPGETLPTSLTSLCIKDVPKLKDLGKGFQHLTSLVKLQIGFCDELQCLPGEMLPTSLTYLCIEDVPKLKDLGKGFQHLTSLDKLQIKLCDELQCLPGEMLPTSLTSLYIEVQKLKDLGKGFPHLTSLDKLEIRGCIELQCLPGETLPTSLTSLYIEVQKLKDLGKGFQHLTSLDELIIRGCIELQCLPGETLPTSLTSLWIQDVPKLEHSFQHLTSLKKLSISNDENLQSFPGEWLPTSLTSLHINSIPNLKDLGKSFHHLVSLRKLHIRSCNNLQFLPEEGLPSSLSILQISDCPLLAQRCQRETGEYWPKIAHIRRGMQRFCFEQPYYSRLSNRRSRSQILTARVKILNSGRVLPFPCEGLKDELPV